MTTTSKAIDAGSAVASFLYRVIGEPLESLSGTYISDPLKELRKRRLMDLQTKTELYFSTRLVVETRALPPPVAVPLLEAASIETDDGLHDLWAALLAEAMDATRPPLDRRLVFAIKALTPECVPALELMWKELLSAQKKLSSNDRGAVDMKHASNWAELHTFSFQEARIEVEFVEHLVGLGLFQHPSNDRKARGFTMNLDHVGVTVEGKDLDYDRVRCSSLGLKLLEAVMVRQA